MHGFFVHREKDEFPQKGERNGEGKFIHRESTHREQEMWRKGVGRPCEVLSVTLRRGDPCGRPREGQSPSPTHHKIRIRRGRRLPTVVPTDSRSLSCPPIGALPRNRLASSATGSASPISPTARTGFSRTHGRAHGPCPTRRCVIGPGRTGPSAPIRPLSPGLY